MRKGRAKALLFCAAWTQWFVCANQADLFLIPVFKPKHLAGGDIKKAAKLPEGFDIHFIFADFVHAIGCMRKPQCLTNSSLAEMLSFSGDSKTIKVVH